MILYTQAKVPMTEFKVDVMIGGSREENSIVMQNRYGFSEEDLQNDLEPNACESITSGLNGFIPPQKIFLLRLKKKPIDDLPTFIHELWHLMWHISDVIDDFKLNIKTQSWAACMIEDLSIQILNAQYEELNLEYGE